MVFFVTGGSRGIGAAIVLEAIRQGHEVAFTYVANEAAAGAVVEQARSIDPARRCLAYQLDVRRSAQVEEVVDRAVDTLDTIDALVNCAGITQDAPLVWMSDEQWEAVLATNLTGAFYCTRQVLPVMVANRKGSIINVSSINRDGAPGQANYAASKAGLQGLTRTIAKEYGRKGIRANIVIPGLFETGMTEEALPRSVRDFWEDLVPMPGGRMGNLDEISGVVIFLASERASFINGAVIPVTGGLDWSR